MNHTFSVGLEQGSDGAMLAHSFSVPGCVAAGSDAEAALAELSSVLAAWLETLSTFGERIPSRDDELELAVDEWIETDAAVAAGQTSACFEHDLIPLSDAEISAGLRRLGDLRGGLLARLKHTPPAALDELRVEGLTLRQTLDELARAQWWLLGGLGASPMAEIPDAVLGRLDTAMALVVQAFQQLPAERRAQLLEIDGEEWTPRKVLRRLLWVEWVLGNAALAALREEVAG